ncbi:6-bladed beta-propeller [Candidatus Aminicenantes bacterium AC-708-M15]|nr:6-bladed beta-propeller [SCandidatus Aminicenantes bacterium Aminicenantia_JdfR_composite]MCP2598510.1 6-bladed beta-propeller [Candidatus Aminicenantes bacterium AC-335-L06]MCP2604262.1 6-bladed beta-propeller [Candidatus Aminicenantes bacterium AC-708-M15]MCP2620792.1 6-bladed beta-propeller [Candidatus Aminicenantes bacterium AC-334-E05]
MKKFFLFLLSLILFFSFFCKKQEKIIVKNIDGVEVIFNPKEPAHIEGVPNKLTLKEELTIGDKDKDEYIFSRIIDIAIDDMERIYAADAREGHIKIFDKNGNYIKTIGKKGKGPGEFYFIFSIQIIPQNKLVVIDIGNRRISFFNLNGEFIKSISPGKIWALRCKIDSKGNFIVTEGVSDPKNPRYELKKLDSNFNLIKKFAQSPFPSPEAFNPFMPFNQWILTENDYIYYSYPEDYEIKIFDPSGNLVKKIVKEYEPVEITEEEKKEVMRRAPRGIKFAFSKYHSAFQIFSVDDEGRIFVRTWEKTEDGEGYYYDIFDPKGRYIAKIPLKIIPRVWKKEKLYTIEEDEEGFPVIKRYKVIWQ